MKHFYSFQKRKGLALEANSFNNENLIHQLNHELMKYGYFLDKEVFDALSTQSVAYIQNVYNELMTGIEKVIGTGTYEPIYTNFPQSVIALSYKDFLFNAIIHYWTFGQWRPEDTEHFKREFKIEPVKYKKIGLITKNQFDSIFTDIIYSGSSISPFDKEIIDWFITNGYDFDLSKITFKETSAYIGQRLLQNPTLEVLPTKDATNVLRIYSVYSGGDEGLKTNVAFKQLGAVQRKLIMATLENAYNLEESFKTYREKWLRVLFYLNPLTKKNANKYPNLYKHTVLLRNSPKELKTFNSRVEELLLNKDIEVLTLLKKHRGVFMRRIDHLVRLFGTQALEAWLDTNPNLMDLVSIYNHFTNRDKQQEGRGVVLASQYSSEVATFEALAPLDGELVALIKEKLISRINNNKSKEIGSKKVYIDRSLYYRPLAVNNRASSLSLDGKVNGTCEIVPENAKTIRMYVHWERRNDIDLSAMLITTDNEVIKVGWNGRHRLTESVVYSGDNTGFSDKNAEYIDINVAKLPANVEWIITDARIFSGPSSFKGYDGGARAGWMVREFPKANAHWLPETIEHSVVLDSESRNAYLMAYHVPSRNMVYLDLSMGTSIVQTSDDALKMKIFLKNFITLDNGEDKIDWNKFNQGHVLNVLSENIVDDKADAEVVFDNDTTWEAVAKFL